MTDAVNYKGGGYVLSRQVSEYAAGASLSIGTTAQSITFDKHIASLTVINDSANVVFVNISGATPVNRNTNDATTVAGSAVIDLGTDVATLGIQVRDLITLDEGDGNDGTYAIKSISGDTITINETLTVNHSGNQDYVIQSPQVAAGEVLTFSAGTQVIGLLADGASSAVKIIVAYQTVR